MTELKFKRTSRPRLISSKRREKSLGLTFRTRRFRMASAANTRSPVADSSMVRGRRAGLYRGLSWSEQDPSSGETAARQTHTDWLGRAAPIFRVEPPPVLSQLHLPPVFPQAPPLCPLPAQRLVTSFTLKRNTHSILLEWGTVLLQYYYRITVIILFFFMTTFWGG